MELAGKRFGVALLVSATLHAAVAAMLMRTAAPRLTAVLEPARILVDLRFLEVGMTATAPNRGPTVIAPGPAPVAQPAPAVVPQVSIASVAPLEPLPQRQKSHVQPKPVTHESETPPRINAEILPKAETAPPVDSGDAQASLAPPSSSASASPQGVAPAGAPGLIGHGPGSTAPNVGAAVRIRYEQQLYVWLARFKEYPMVARRRGLEGTGSIRVRLDRKGRVLERSVDRSTGERLLDDAAVDMTRRADPFPPVPADYQGESFEFVAPIEFRLR